MPVWSNPGTAGGGDFRLSTALAPNTNGRLGTGGAGEGAVGTGAVAGADEGAGGLRGVLRGGRDGAGEGLPSVAAAAGEGEADAGAAVAPGDAGAGEPGAADADGDPLGTGGAAGEGAGDRAAAAGRGAVCGFEGQSVSNVRPAQKPKATSRMASTSVPRLDAIPREPAGFSPSAFAIGR
jgi:hypothetical protein